MCTSASVYGLILATTVRLNGLMYDVLKSDLYIDIFPHTTNYVFHKFLFQQADEDLCLYLSLSDEPTAPPSVPRPCADGSCANYEDWESGGNTAPLGVLPQAQEVLQNLPEASVPPEVLLSLLLREFYVKISSVYLLHKR